MDPSAPTADGAKVEKPGAAADAQQDGPKAPTLEWASSGAPANGAELLRDLSSRPPAEVTSWALSQVKQLESADADVTKLPIFQVVGALQSVEPAQREAFVRGVIGGVSQLDTAQRTEAVRFGMRVQQLQQEASTGVSKDEKPPPIVANVKQLLQEVKVDEIPKEEKADLAKVVQEEAVTALRPDQLLDVFGELEEGERAQLADTLVTAKVVQPEQRQVIDEAIKKDGPIDKARDLLAWARVLYNRSCLLALLPLVELALSFAVSCSDSLVIWLYVDVVLLIIVFAMVYGVIRCASPLTEELQKDPLAALQRGRGAASLGEGIKAVAPAMDDGAQQRLVCFLFSTALFLLLLAAWALFGLVGILLDLDSSCLILAIICRVVLVGFRVFAVCWFAMLTAQVVREAMKLVPKKADDSPSSYGTMDQP